MLFFHRLAWRRICSLCDYISASRMFSSYRILRRILITIYADTRGISKPARGSREERRRLVIVD